MLRTVLIVWFLVLAVIAPVWIPVAAVKALTLARPRLDSMRTTNTKSPWLLLSPLRSVAEKAGISATGTIMFKAIWYKPSGTGSSAAWHPRGRARTAPRRRRR